MSRILKKNKKVELDFYDGYKAGCLRALDKSLELINSMQVDPGPMPEELYNNCQNREFLEVFFRNLGSALKDILVTKMYALKNQYYEKEH